MSETIKVSEDMSIKVDEYKGEYSLVSVRKGFEQWAKYRTSKDGYASKDWPVKVTLGDAKTATKVLHQILEQINGTPF